MSILILSSKAFLQGLVEGGGPSVISENSQNTENYGFTFKGSSVISRFLLSLTIIVSVYGLL